LSVLDVKKIERCKKLLLEEYFNTSIIELTMNTVDYDEDSHKDLEFRKFGKWVYIPREWFTDPTIIPDYVFREIGRGIAIGEENYIVQQILTHPKVTLRHIEKFDYESLIKALHELRSVTNLILFVPIKYFVPIHVNWAIKHKRVRIEKNDLYVNGARIKVFWSSKYVDFDKIILARKSFGKWIAKPTVGKRLEVEIKESSEKPDQLELKAQTIFNFRILNFEQIKVLDVPEPENRL